MIKTLCWKKKKGEYEKKKKPDVNEIRKVKLFNQT